MNNFSFNFIAIVSLLIGMVGSVQAQPPAPATGIRVLVYGIHYGSNIVYNYKVINNGERSIRNFIIGREFDSVKNYAYPQLTRLPLGWTYGREGETGTAIILAPGSTSQPTGWQSSVRGQQDTSSYYLEWNSYLGDKSSDIHPGQTLAGFSVTVPLVDNELDLPAAKGSPVFMGPDEKYVKGNFKVDFFYDRNLHEFWGPLELADTAPPALTVSLSPNTLWPPNGKLVPITATITVKDDYDPDPEIKLESIFASGAATASDVSDEQPGTDDRQFSLAAKREGTNQAGRIYTVTYSATDGSGNKATASATVTVPHDQGKK